MANQRRTFRRRRSRRMRIIIIGQVQEEEEGEQEDHASHTTAFLKRIRLGAATAVCRLVPESGSVRLVRRVILTGIAPSPY